MGILRATKYKTFLKLGTAIFLLSTFIVANLAPLSASADVVAPALPISWVDNAHTSAVDAGVDAGGNLYKSIGYACVVGAPSITNSAGTSIDTSNAGTNGTVKVNVETETCSGTPFKVPGCANSTVAEYVWVSTNTSTHYALIVYSPVKTQIDPKQCPVNTKTGCYGVVWVLSTGGALDTGSGIGNPVGTGGFLKVTTMIVDPTVAARAIVPTPPTPSSCGGFSLDWILCGIIQGLSGAVDSIYTGVVEPMLNTPNVDPTTASGSKIFDAWSSFRIYGDIFLVIALLVMVFGQVIGGGIIDAYTAKKILPRLLAAAILLNLSYYLVAVAIDFSNILGKGLGQLITAPFGLSGGFDLSTLNGSAQATIAGTTTVATGIAGGVATSFIVGAGSLTAAAAAGMAYLWTVVLIPVLLVFLAIMSTLIVRLGLIYLLILFSPIAFALYALPNTEQYFKKWWKTLFTTMLVFPIISVLFGISKVMAQTTIWATGANGVTGGFGYILSLLVLIAPLVAIPFAFKLGGGILGRMHDITSGAGSKIKEMSFLKNGRERAKQQAGLNVANGRSRMITGFGKTGLGRRVAGSHILGGATRRAIEGADQRSRILAGEIARDPRAAAIKDDDNAKRAQTYLSAEAAFTGLTTEWGLGDNPAEAHRAIAAVQAANGFGRAQSIEAAQRMTDGGTAFRTIEDVARTIARVSGGNGSTIAGLSGYINSVSKQASRGDLAPGFATLRELSNAVATGGPNAVTADRYNSAVRQAWNSIDISTVVRSKTREVEVFATAFRDIMNDPNASGLRKRDAAIALSELQAALPGATGDNQRWINDSLANVGINHEATRIQIATRNMTDERGNLLRDPTGNVLTETYSQPVAVTVEEQLANVASGLAIDDGSAAPRVITESEINGLARKYGSSTPRSARGEPDPSASTPPPPAGGDTGTN